MAAIPSGPATWRAAGVVADASARTAASAGAGSRGAGALEAGSGSAAVGASLAGDETVDFAAGFGLGGFAPLGTALLAGQQILAATS